MEYRRCPASMYQHDGGDDDDYDGDDNADAESVSCDDKACGDDNNDEHVDDHGDGEWRG